MLFICNGNNTLYYILVVTKYLLCSVSMLLTGLFCIELSEAASSFYIATVALVVVGLGVDLSKYIFFYYQQASQWYFVLAVLLTFFSWSASLAFFMANEQHNLDKARVETTDYQIHEARIEGIRQQIQSKTAILKQRLRSSYHAQWDKADMLVREIQQDEALLQRLMHDTESVGKVSAQRSSKTSALFYSLSVLLGASVSTVTLIGYSLLALLIECCSLGAISLSKAIQPLTEHKGNVQKALMKQQNEKEPATIEEKMERLKKDIVAGKTDPIIRRIKRSGYQLSENNIRAVLIELKAEGVLVNGPKNLVLSQAQ